MKQPSILEMLQAGVHFGHQKSRWHPKMADFIFTERHGVHILDLEQTQQQIKEVCEHAKNMASEGKQILFVSTKPQAREIVKAAAIDCGMPFLVDRWIGGFLTNFAQIKKLLKHYIEMKQKLEAGELEKYTKKERLDIERDLQKKDTYLGGLVSLEKIPDALFVPAVQREKTAMVEANRTGVPVIGVCDTNANPRRVQHVIAANDDAVRSIKLVVECMAEAIKEGKAEWEKKKSVAEKKAEKPAAKKGKPKAADIVDQSV